MAKLTVNRFAQKDSGQTTWINEEKGLFSGAISVSQTKTNFATGFRQTEKFNVWLTANSEEDLVEGLEEMIDEVKAGRMVPVRLYYTEPLGDWHKPDINPSTGEELDRYSTTRLAPKAEAPKLHRTYQEVPVRANSMTPQEITTNE